MILKVKLLSENGQLPTKAHAGDLGYDLYASERTVLFDGQTVLVPTDIAIQFPAGWGGIIKDRSSVATKRAVFTVAGVIDNGYTGHIRIAMHNASGDTQVFQQGEKIAQLVLMPTTNFPVVTVDDVESADGRSENGFGSTGQ